MAQGPDDNAPYGSVDLPVRQDMFQYIVEVHWPKKKPEDVGDEDQPRERVFRTFVVNTFGLESDGQAVGTSRPFPFSGAIVGVSGTVFASVFGIGKIAFEAHINIVRDSDGAIVASSESQAIQGSTNLPDDDTTVVGEQFNGQKEISASAPNYGGFGLTIEVVVTTSEVTDKHEISGVWFGGASSGVSGVVEYLG